MAYGNYFPVTYQPNYYGQPNPYYQQMQNQAMMQQNQQMQQAQQQGQQMQQPAIQQSGLVLIPSEQDARNYPVAPGNSITFKDENAPYCYVKTMGFNQLDRPTFERYRLVKEEMPPETAGTRTSADSTGGSKDTAYALKSDLGAIWSEIDAIKEKLKTQTDKKPAKKKLIEVEAEEDDE